MTTIAAALEKYAQEHPAGANNLFKFSLTELKDLGYRRAKSEDEWSAGDILHMDKDGLFALIDENGAKWIRKQSKKEIGAAIVFRK